MYWVHGCLSSLTTDETLEEDGRKITSNHQWGAGDNHPRPDPFSSNSQKAVYFTTPITPSNLLSPTMFEDKRHGSGVTPWWCEEGGNLLVYLANFTPCEIVWFRAQSELLFTLSISLPCHSLLSFYIPIWFRQSHTSKSKLRFTELFNSSQMTFVSHTPSWQVAMNLDINDVTS